MQLPTFFIRASLRTPSTARRRLCAINSASLPPTPSLKRPGQSGGTAASARLLPPCLPSLPLLCVSTYGAVIAHGISNRHATKQALHLVESEFGSRQDPRLRKADPSAAQEKPMAMIPAMAASHIPQYQNQTSSRAVAFLGMPPCASQTVRHRKKRVACWDRCRHSNA
jgi:hypothetical protein